MHNTLQNDLDNLDYLLSLTKDKAAAYLTDINERPVSINNIQVTIPINLPENGIGLEDRSEERRVGKEC